LNIYSLGEDEDDQIKGIGVTGGNDYTDNGIEAASPLNQSVT